MKQLYAAIFSVGMAGTLTAQLTQQNHAPAPGDTYTMISVDPAGINPGASGNNVTWNFSSVQLTNVAMDFTVASASNANYPNANVVSGYVGNQSYLSSSSSSLAYYGGDIEVQTVKASLTYTSPAVWAVYPMNLNSNATATTGGNFNASQPFPVSGTFTGTSMVEADGMGTLILPLNTYSNVMRVRTTQTLDVSAGGGTINGSIIQEIYEYYGNLKSPLFSIMSATLNIGVPNSQTIASINKEATVVGTPTTGIAQLSKEQIIVYPNPAAHEVHLLGLPESGTVEFFDITGKSVKMQKVTSSRMTIDITDLSGGIYMYSVADQTARVIGTGKLTVAD